VVGDVHICLSLSVDSGGSGVIGKDMLPLIMAFFWFVDMIVWLTMVDDVKVCLRLRTASAEGDG
jgi:hypothetical protein